MSEMLNKITQLCNAMAEDGYQTRFEGDFNEANMEINEDLSRIVGYQNTIIQNTIDRTMIMSVTPRIIEENPALQGIDFKALDRQVDQRNKEGLDRARTGIADLNNLCHIYHVPEIGPSKDADVYEVADFVGNFCSQIYEDGQPRTEDELMDYREKDKRTDRYETANALVQTLLGNQKSVENENER